MQEKDVTKLQVAVGVLTKQGDRFQTQLDRVEKKIDEMTYAKQSDLDAFKEEVERRYVTKDENQPLKTLFWAIISTILLGIVGAGVALLLGNG